MRTKTCLSLDDANIILTAAKAFAQRKGFAVSIAVVDDAGVPLHLERLDGAMAPSCDMALRKAASAALMKRPTELNEEPGKARPGMLTIPHFVALRGGLPILFKGECLGGVGVAGAAGQEDLDVASAGIAALRLDP